MFRCLSSSTKSAADDNFTNADGQPGVNRTDSRPFSSQKSVLASVAGLDTGSSLVYKTCPI